MSVLLITCMFIPWLCKNKTPSGSGGLRESQLIYATFSVILGLVEVRRHQQIL